MIHQKKLLLNALLFLFLLGTATLGYSQSSTTTTEIETINNPDGTILERTTTTTTTILESKIEKTEPTYGGEFTDWKELNCDNPVVKIPVKRIQESLKQRGYYHGAIDSVFGPRTKSALLKFRVANGYSAEILVDECILGIMGIVVAQNR